MRTLTVTLTHTITAVLTE